MVINKFVSHNFQIKFCDFGLATAFDGKIFNAVNLLEKQVHLLTINIHFACFSVDFRQGNHANTNCKLCNSRPLSNCDYDI